MTDAQKKRLIDALKQVEGVKNILQELLNADKTTCKT